MKKRKWRRVRLSGMYASSPKAKSIPGRRSGLVSQALKIAKPKRRKGKKKKLKKVSSLAEPLQVAAYKLVQKAKRKTKSIYDRR